MKVAILSDIHGNASALNEVLKKAAFEKVSKYLVLGDIVGYYYRPKEVLDLLSVLDYDLVRGNHEDILMRLKENRIDKEALQKKYGSGHFHAIEQLNEDEFSFLTKSPVKKALTLDGLNIIICHGSPLDNNQYLYPDTKKDILEQNSIKGVDYVFVGHSHYQFMYQSSSTTLINVGSVGQSRQKGGVANWALLDTKDNTIRLMETTYDIQPVILDINKYDPNNNYIRDILNRNR